MPLLVSAKEVGQRYRTHVQLLLDCYRLVTFGIVFLQRMRWSFHQAAIADAHSYSTVLGLQDLRRFQSMHLDARIQL